MASKERPPLRVVISDPAGGKTVVKVKVKGVDNIPFRDSMMKTKEKERTELPIAKINEKLFKQLNLEPTKVMTLRLRIDNKKLKIPFKVEVDDTVPDGEVWVSNGLLSEVASVSETEAEAFRTQSWQLAVGDQVVRRLVGFEIGDVIDGSLFSLPNIKLKITGGTDASGIPMHPGVPGTSRREVLLSGPPGFKPKRSGEKRRKSVRGRMIPDPSAERRKTALAQLNLTIVYE
ncbi:MAG: S6e family ribosomal protein [Acidilobaceae archaeon]